jgi:hypothetical protein
MNRYVCERVDVILCSDVGIFMVWDIPEVRAERAGLIDLQVVMERL